MRPDSVRDLITKLGYQGRVQHLTCWLCFGHGLPDVPQPIPLEKLRSWRKAAVAFTREHGWPPHPVPLLSGNLLPKALLRAAGSGESHFANV